MRNRPIDSIESINERLISRINLIKTSYIHHFTPSVQEDLTIQLHPSDPADFEKLLAIQYCADSGFLSVQQNKEQETILMTLKITVDGIDFYEDYILENAPEAHGL